MSINSIPQLEQIESLQVFQERDERMKSKKNSMHDILKYQYILLKIFGLSFFEEQNYFITIYSFSCIFINLINVIKAIWNYKFIYGLEFHINSSNCFDIIYHLLVIAALICNIFMVYIQRVDKKIEKLNWKLDQELGKNFIDQKIINYIKLRSLYILVPIVLHIFFNLIIGFLSIVGVESIYPVFKRIWAPFTYETWVKNNVFYKLISLLLCIPSSGAAVFTLSYYCYYCVVVSSLYINMDKIIFKINKKIKFVSNEIENNEDWETVINSTETNEVFIDENGFDKIFDCFLRLNSITNLLNNVFNKLTLAFILLCLPSSCLCLYVFADRKMECEDSINLFLVISNIIFNILFILGFSIVSANINFYVI